MCASCKTETDSKVVKAFDMIGCSYFQVAFSYHSLSYHLLICALNQYLKCSNIRRLSEKAEQHTFKN